MAARGTRGGRGGVRQGTPGKAYGERTDLNENRAPVTGLKTPAIGGLPSTPPQATPIPGPNPATVALGNPGAPAASAAQPAPSQVGTAPQVTPDMVTPLDAPTQRPDEPVTAGVGGPQQVAGQWATTRDVVGAAARNPNASPALQAMAARLRVGY